MGEDGRVGAEGLAGDFREPRMGEDAGKKELSLEENPPPKKKSLSRRLPTCESRFLWPFIQMNGP